MTVHWNTGIHRRTASHRTHFSYSQPTRCVFQTTHITHTHTSGRPSYVSSVDDDDDDDDVHMWCITARGLFFDTAKPKKHVFICWHIYRLAGCACVCLCMHRTALLRVCVCAMCVVYTEGKPSSARAHFRFPRSRTHNYEYPIQTHMRARSLFEYTYHTHLLTWVHTYLMCVCAVRLGMFCSRTPMQIAGQCDYVQYGLQLLQWLYRRRHEL